MSATRLDRLAWWVCALSGALSAGAVVVGFTLAVLLPGLGVFPVIGKALLLPCVVLDLCSFYVVVARIVRETGPSGFPVLAWVYSALFSLSGVSGAWWWRLLGLARVTAFYGVCQYVLPLYLAMRMGWRPSEGEYPYWPVGRGRRSEGRGSPPAGAEP